MESLRELYRIGLGPSSSHTMGPHHAACYCSEQFADAVSFCVRLTGSLAATGNGHLTDQAIRSGLAPKPVKFLWEPETLLAGHPNGMVFDALDNSGASLGTWTVFSVGDGSLQETPDASETQPIYPVKNMTELLQWSIDNAQPFWCMVQQYEDVTSGVIWAKSGTPCASRFSADCKPKAFCPAD